MAKTLDWLTALRYRQRLRGEVVCSECWLETIIEPSDDCQTWLYWSDVYPPGGKTTLMRSCPTCRRICPPAGADGSPCYDCQTEREERDFLKWALRRRDLLPDLNRRWWRSAISYGDFMERPTAGLLGNLCLEQIAEDMPEAEEGNAFYTDASGPTTSDERNQTRNVTDPRLSLQIAIRRLDPPKKEKGRCPGCQVLLLPEEESAMRKEIAYFETNDRVIPSARRYSKYNPYLAAPENYDSQTAYAEDVDPDAATIDAEVACDW